MHLLISSMVISSTYQPHRALSDLTTNSLAPPDSATVPHTVVGCWLDGS